MARALGHIIRASVCCAVAVVSCACALLAAPSQALAVYGGSIEASSFPVELFDGTGFYWDTGERFVYSQSDAASINQAQVTSMSFNTGDTVSVIRVDYVSKGFSERTSRNVTAYYIMRTDSNSASDDFAYYTEGGGYLVFGDSYTRTLCGELTIDYVNSTPVYHRSWYLMSGQVEIPYPTKSTGKYKITVIYTNNNAYWQVWNISQVVCEKSFSLSLLPSSANFFDAIIDLLETISQKMNYTVSVTLQPVLDAISNFSSQVHSSFNTLNGKVDDVSDSVDDNTSQSITNTGNITRALDDVGDDVDDAASTVSDAIDGLSGQYTDSIDAINLRLQSIAGDAEDIPDKLDAISTDIGGAASDIGDAISALPSAISSTLPDFGTTQWGSGTSSAIDANAKTQFDTLLRQKAPIGYVVRLSDELLRMANKYNSQSAGLASNDSLYINIPVPYAGNVRFDLKNSFLGNTVAGYSLHSGLRYALTIILTLGTILSFARIAIAIAFGGGSDD